MEATTPKSGTVRTIEWADGKVRLIDQTKLPLQEVYVECDRWEEVAHAIRSMQIRGAPAIGVAAAMGIALGAQAAPSSDPGIFEMEFQKVAEGIKATRPTARNLFWAAERMQGVLEATQGAGVPEIKKALISEAKRILEEDIDANQRMGRVGADLIDDGDTVLTHCNAGALATGGYGTALGVIRAAWSQGKRIKVLADETRPLLQGARLTAWELKKDKIPFALITDGMAGYMMAKGQVDKVVVGADRIAGNGDVANKIGTYAVAVLAKENGVPFYVAAPFSTIDLKCPTGAQIPVEERGADEVVEFGGVRVAPAEAQVHNPAFDVTPNRYVSAIVTEAGLARTPFNQGFEKLTNPG